jgi:hypothetical protein
MCALEAELQLHVTKPVEPEELALAVASLARTTLVRLRAEQDAVRDAMAEG